MFEYKHRKCLILIVCYIKNNFFFFFYVISLKLERLGIGRMKWTQITGPPSSDIPHHVHRWISNWVIN